MPKVSIVCSAFNAERFIKQSIDSILSQSFSDYEFIIVDDASTDNTKDIIERYGQLFTNIVTIYNPHNNGLFKSRTTAIRIAKGEYIAIQDADDWSHPQRIEKEVKILEENKNIVFLGTYAIKIDEDSKIIGKMTYPTHFTETALLHIQKFKLNPIIDPSCMFRKDIFIKHGGYNLSDEYRTCADFELWSRLLLHGYEMTNITEYLIAYRINTTGMTSTKYTEMRSMTDNIVIRFKNRLLKDPIN